MGLKRNKHCFISALGRGKLGSRCYGCYGYVCAILYPADAIENSFKKFHCVRAGVSVRTEQPISGRHDVRSGTLIGTNLWG